MTATYDPTDPKYFDPAALREEVDRVFDLCHGCRLCFNLCPSFPTLFGFIDANDGDVSSLTDAERGQVVDECYQCKLCYVKCPYVPPHEWELDFPRLMSRVHAVRQKQLVGVKERVTDQFLGRTDVLGRGVGGGRAGGQLGDGHTGFAAAPDHGEGDGAGVPADPAPLRQAALHDVVHEVSPPDGGSAGRRGGLGVPDLLRGIHGARCGACHRGGLRAQRRGLQSARGHQVLRCPVAALGPGRRVHQGGPPQRGGTGRRGAGRARRDRGATHLRLRREAGLSDLRQGAGRGSGGRAHVRPGGVPDAPPP